MSYLRIVTFLRLRNGTAGAGANIVETQIDHHKPIQSLDITHKLIVGNKTKLLAAPHPMRDIRSIDGTVETHRLRILRVVETASVLSVIGVERMNER